MGTLVGAAAVAGCGGAAPAATPSASPPAWAGATLVQALPKPSFTLTDDRGRPFDFATQTRGKVTLLYFGYTHCPDVCPANMADTALALRDLPADVRSRIAVVFVTTDPGRDTPSVLHAWLARFDPTFIGLTGSLAQVEAVQHSAGVPASAFESDGHGGYGVDHAGYVIAYTTDGMAHITYPEGVRPADEARDLQRLVTAGWTGT